MNALRSHCCKPFVPSVTLLRFSAFIFMTKDFLLCCTSFDVQKFAVANFRECFAFPGLGCLVYLVLQTLILKILIQYSVFKVQII